MKINLDTLKNHKNRIDFLSNWHKWYAWRPIFVEKYAIKQLVWLEYVERKLNGYKYRLPQDG